MDVSLDALQGQLPRQASDLRQQQERMTQHVQQLQQLAPEAIKDHADRMEFLEQLQESLLNAKALVDIVTEQQRLTGEDPLTPAAYAAALNARAEEEAEETSYVDLEVIEAEPDSYGDELNSETKLMLMRVMGVVDALDRTQLMGLVHLAKCNPHQVRSIFSELRTKLRNSTTAAAKRASKAIAAEAAAAAATCSAVAGHQQSQHHHLLDRVSPPLGYHQPPPDMQQQQGTGPAAGMTGSHAAAVESGSADCMLRMGPTCSRIAASIAEQREKLARVLDQETGTITSGGRFLGLLGSLSSWAGRSAALAALEASCNTQATAAAAGVSRPWAVRGDGARGSVSGGPRGGASAAVRAQLVSSRLLDVLESWLVQAKRDRQVTVMKQLLQVLPHIGISSALLQSSGLAAEVSALHRHPHPAVAAAAQAATQAWTMAAGQQLLGSTGLSGRQYGGLQHTVPGQLIPYGGSHTVTAAYKRSTTLVIKRQVEEMALVGDLKRHRGAAATAATGKGSLAAAGAVKSSNAQSAGTGSAATGAAASTTFKRPSKRMVAPAAAATAAAAGQASAPISDAARRLTALHALSSSKGTPGGQPREQQQQQQQQQRKTVDQLWAALPQQQRLHAMTPHGRAAATFLAASGVAAAEVTQAVQAYDRAVQVWKQQRCAAAAKEQAAAAEVMAILQQPQQLSQSWQQCLAQPETAAWPEPPPLQPANCFDNIPGGWAAGQDSQLARSAAHDWLQQYTALGNTQRGTPPQPPLEPDGAGETEQTGAAGAAACVRIPLHPTAAAEATKERAQLWLAGVRLPSQLGQPPSVSELARARKELHLQEHPQQQQQQAGIAAPEHQYPQQQQQLVRVQQQQPMNHCHQQQQQQPQAAQYHKVPPQQELQHVVYLQQQQQQQHPQQYSHVPQLLPVQALQQQQQHCQVAHTPQPHLVFLQPHPQQQRQQLPPSYMPAQQPQPRPQQQQQVVFVVPSGPPTAAQVVHVVHVPQQQQDPYNQGYFPQGY